MEFIYKEKSQRPLLVGHSLGSAFSLSIGIRLPQKIRGIALICPAYMAIDSTPEVFRDLEIRHPAARAFFKLFVLNFHSDKTKKVLTEIFKLEPINPGFDIKEGALLS